MIDLDALIAKTRSSRGGRGTGSFAAAVRAEVAEHPTDPRPSRVFARMVQHNAALYAQRGQILARAYAELPNQPKRGTSKPPLTARTITRPDEQKIEIQAGTLTAVEPFAGAGLLGLALHLEGVVTVDACEIDKWAVSTQNLNAHRWFGLGWLAKPTDARRWKPMRVKGGVDLLIGGPPCKAFSGAARMGRRQTELGPSAKDNFFPDALDWIADLQPRLVVFENAAELALNKDNRAWLDEIWAPQLLNLGYRMEVFVLYAPDFGTPQNRRRTWVVCTPVGSTWVADRDVFAKGPPPTHAAPGSEAVKARRLLPWVPMHDRLVGGCCGGYGLVDCVHLGNDQIRCRTCVNGSNFDPAPNSMGQTYGRKKLEGVTVKSRRKGRTITVGEYMMEAVSDARPDQLRYTKFNPADFAGAFPQASLMQVGRTVTRYLSKTVLPHFAKFPEGLMIPPGLDKWGSVRELSKRQAKALVPKLEIMSARDAAKLQDIPQWYAFDGPRSAVFNQIGMGVPVNMGRSVIRWVRRSMGLPVRQPWWKAQTSPLFDTWPPRVPLGLWPLEAMDPCMAFPGVLEDAVYSHEQALYDWSEIEQGGMIGEQWETRTQNRFARPSESLRPLTRRAEQQARTVGQQLWQIFPDGYIDGEALWKSGWRPAGPYDAPEPFEDVGWFAEFLRERSVNPGWYNLWAMLYRTKFPGVRMSATSTSHAGPIESLWEINTTEAFPQVWPSDAPFTRAQVQAAMRGEKIKVRKAPRRQRPTVDLDALIARFKS